MDGRASRGIDSANRKQPGLCRIFVRPKIADSLARDETSAKMVYSLSRPVTIFPGCKTDARPLPVPDGRFTSKNGTHENQRHFA
jgi:hypothetical protein